MIIGEPSIIINGVYPNSSIVLDRSLIHKLGEQREWLEVKCKYLHHILMWLLQQFDRNLIDIPLTFPSVGFEGFMETFGCTLRVPPTCLLDI